VLEEARRLIHGRVAAAARDGGDGVVADHAPDLFEQVVLMVTSLVAASGHGDREDAGAGLGDAEFERLENLPDHASLDRTAQFADRPFERQIDDARGHGTAPVIDQATHEADAGARFLSSTMRARVRATC